MIQPLICPICQKPAEDSVKMPFCSDRCRKVDFMRWWDGKYAVIETLDEEQLAAGGDEMETDHESSPE